ncbi:MAG TPA: hypothetical protein VL651_05625, partial [Bacteroidia bacterium]|nr:hypothetical protein [Bacteroidia bacterium]
MKKVILLSAVFCFSHILVKSQVYAGLGFGYGLPMAKDVIGTNSENNNPANTFSEDNVYGSFGSGANAHAYVGYWFNDVIGVDLGVNYLAGRKYTFTSNSVNSSNVTNDQKDEMWARALRITPALRIGLGNGDIHPYFLAGLSIGVMNKIT